MDLSRRPRVVCVLDCPEKGAMGSPLRIYTKQVLDAGLQRVGLASVDSIRGVEYNTVILTLHDSPLPDEYKGYLAYGVKGKSAAFLEDQARLLDRIKAYNPMVVITFGDASLHALTDLKPPKSHSRRGSVYYVPGTEIKVIPTINPVTLLKDPSLQLLSHADLKKAVEQANSREFILPEVNLITSPTYQQVMDYLDRGLKSLNLPDSMVSFDVEGVEWLSCISFAFDKYTSMSIPFVNEQGAYFTAQEETAIWIKIKEILENPKFIKLNQNLMYEGTVLHRIYGIILAGPFHDTMIAQGILYPDYDKDLGSITRWWTPFNYYKDEGAEWIKGFKGTSWDTLWKYNAMDAIIPQWAIEPQLATMKRQHNMETYSRQLGLIAPLLYMQAVGSNFDRKSTKIRAKEVQERIAELEAQLLEVVGFDLNARSPKQMKEYFYETLKLPKKVNKGKPTVDEKALKAFKAKGVPAAVILIELKHLQTLLSGFLEVVLDKDHRLRCSFNPAGTKSGRISSSKYLFQYGRNLMNLPKKTAVGDPTPFRSLLIADPGMIWVAVDLAQAENRIVGYIAPEPAMIFAFEHGVDLHTQTAALILDKKLDEVTKEERSKVGKPANHGLNYGLGYRHFAETHEVTEKWAKMVIAKYHHAYPGVHKYHAWTTAKVNSDHYLVNPLGRRRYFFGRITEGDTSGKPIFYHIPQSTVADVINTTLTAIYEDQKTYKDVSLRLQIHDELAFQLPADMPIPDMLYILQRVKDSLEKPLRWEDKTFVIPAEFKLGYDLHNMIEMHGLCQNDLEQVLLSLKPR